MRNLLVIKDTQANQISYFHLLLLMASLPFDIFYSHLILISLFLHTLIHFNKNGVKPLFKPGIFILQSVFFVSLLSTIYTININSAFNELGRLVTILLFPLLFCINPLDIKKYRHQLLLSFSLVCTVTIVYLYIQAFTIIRHYYLPGTTLFSSYFANHNFSQPIDMHATFFSMQVVIALVYMLSQAIKKRRFYSGLIYIICTCVLAAGLIQLSSKSVFVAFIIVVNIAFPYFLLKGAKRTRFIVAAASVTLLTAIVIFNSGEFKKRFVTDLKEDLSVTPPGAPDDSRMARWKPIAELIGKSPIIGYGAGSEMGLLQDSFFNHKLFNSYLFKLNAHNAYLSFLIKSGIWGLLVYIGTLAFGLRLSFRRKDLLFLTFITVVIIVSLSENLLDVDKGSFYYAFFFSFFAFSGHEQKVDNPKSKSEIISILQREEIAEGTFS